MTVSQLTLDAIKTEVITEVEGSISHIALGSGDTEASIDDTSLQTETYRDALLAEDTVIDTYIGEIFLDTTENNGNDIKEMGSFDAGAGGNMFSRALTNIISKTASMEVTVELNIKVSTLNI